MNNIAYFRSILDFFAPLAAAERSLFAMLDEALADVYTKFKLHF